MGLICGLLKKLIKLSIFSIIIVAFIIFIPNLPPYTKFTSITLDEPQPRVGPLASNGALNNAERVLVDKLLGPESFQLYKGELYTSLATGEIVKISPGGHVTFVTKLGQPCSGLTQEHICGRPLGFQIDEKNNVMYIADAYLGVWKVDLKNDKKQLLVSPRVAIDGRQPKLPNSVALAKNGDLYWTDSSSDFGLKDGAFTSLCDPTGRLFHYNAAKNQSKVLLDNLWFPNGVVVSPDNQFLVVVETLRFSLTKYYIDGPKKGKSEVLVSGLPGIPDNMRALPDGSGLLVGMYVTYDAENPLLTRSMTTTPLVRKLLARVMRLIEIPFEYLNALYPHVMFEEIVYHIGHFKSLSSTLPNQSGLVVVDWNGKIIESYYNTDGSLGHISDAVVFNNRLYTGNPHQQNYIGSVPVPALLRKAFASTAEAPKAKVEAPEKVEKPKVEARKEAPKPVEPVPPKQAKPVEAKPTPKPAPVKVEQPKPAEKPKPVVQPKPAEKPKPVEQPKPAEKPKPVEQPKPAQPKPTPKPDPVKPAQPKQKNPTPKPEVKTTSKPEVKTTPKATAKPTPQAEKKATPEKTTPKPVKTKNAEPIPEDSVPIITFPKKDNPEPAINNKLAPENIPIKEEIPADTAKPSKGKLKVIKKDGPAEIPNPQL